MPKDTKEKPSPAKPQPSPNETKAVPPPRNITHMKGFDKPEPGEKGLNTKDLQRQIREKEVREAFLSDVNFH